MGNNYNESHLLKAIYRSCLKMLLSLLLVFNFGFTSVAQDTISYCGDDPYSTNIGTSGGLIFWGIRIPSSQLTGHSSVSEVLVYIGNSYPGNYNLGICQGGTNAPQTLLNSQSYSFTSNLDRYKSCIFNAPISIDNTQDLWVVFYTNDISYPASACEYTGNPNSELVSFDGNTWYNLSNVSAGLYYSWMIKVVALTDGIPVEISCNGSGEVQKTSIYDGNRCGMTDYYPEGFYASYDFLPDDDSELTHLYVNNVDRINDIYTHHSGSSGMVHTFGFTVSTANSVSSSISINPVFSYRPSNGIAVNFECTGNGQVQKTYTYNGDRCGMTDYYPEGFYASYDFLPDDDSELTHLYVNNVDRINDIYTHHSGSSGMVHTFGFTVSTANSVSSSISVNPVFSIRTYQISAYSADTTMGYVIGAGAYEAGTTAILTAIPYPDYIFVSWNDNNTENPRYITVEDNADYVAHFVPGDGVDILDPNLNFTLFPNPSSDYSTIYLSGISGSVSLSVVDINGRLVASKHFVCDGSCATNLDVKGFAPGTYFVYATTLDGNNTVRKLLVK